MLLTYISWSLLSHLLDVFKCFLLSIIFYLKDNQVGSQLSVCLIWTESLNLILYNASFFPPQDANCIFDTSLQVL